MLTTVIINLDCLISSHDDDILNSTLIPYSDYMLSSLSENYINIIIITQNSQSYTNKILQHHNIFRYISAEIFETDTSHILEILEEIDILPENTLLLDNTTAGLKNASNANIATIAYQPESYSYDTSNCPIIIEGYDEIDIEFIDEQYHRYHNIPLTVAITNRLIIRELSPIDIYELYSIYNKPNVTRYIEPLSSDINDEILKQKSYVKNIYNYYGYGLWGIFLADTNELIGRCGIQNTIVDNEIIVELGYLIDPDYQRQGYALEACYEILNIAKTKYGIDEVCAIIDKENIPSINLALRLSMSLKKKIIYNENECFLYSIKL